MNAETERYLFNRLEYIVEHKDRNFGNARYVRNVFEKVIQNQANRISHRHNLGKDELTLINIEDIKKEI